MSTKIPRAVYADMFGPTKGDRVRLADTDPMLGTLGKHVDFAARSRSSARSCADDCESASWW